MRLDRAKTINPGLMRQRIYIQTKTEGAQDSLGQPTVAYTTFQEAQAYVTAMTGRELEAAQQKWAEARFMVVTHYISGVRRDMRIVLGDMADANTPCGTARLLDILDAEDPYGTRTTLAMICREIPSN